MKPDISYKRHLAKTITWRVIASLVTFVLALIFFSEDPHVKEKAVGIAIVETILKMIFYYAHERVWYRLNLKANFFSKKRHLAKTISWRAIASITTFLIAMVAFKGEPNATEKASGLMVVEMLLKMLIYYWHERIWYRMNFGVKSPKS